MENVQWRIIWVTWNGKNKIIIILKYENYHEKKKKNKFFNAFGMKIQILFSGCWNIIWCCK